MTDTITPEGGGHTVSHHCDWFSWWPSKAAAESALEVHKKKCKEGLS